MSANTHNTVESAVVATLDQGARRTWRAPSSWTFTIVLMVVFFLVMMICLTAGVSMYRSVTGMQTQENAVQMQSGLMTSIVRMNDSADAVELAAGPEGDALVLVETLESGTYETRLYTYQRSIVQEYAIAGHDFNPQGAVAIMESQRFEFAYEDGLITFVTDEGASYAALRSAQSADALASAGFDAAFAEAAGATGVEGAAALGVDADAGSDADIAANTSAADANASAIDAANAAAGTADTSAADASSPSPTTESAGEGR